MNEESSLTKVCHYYEIFMERAHGRHELPMPALQACGMRNLIMAEKTIIISIESVAHFEEQLIEIKKHMEEALDLYISKPGITMDITNELKEYKDRVVRAVNSDELMYIIRNTNQLTNTLLKTKQ